MKEKSLNVNKKGIAESLATKIPQQMIPDYQVLVLCFLVHLCGEVTKTGMSNKKLNRCDITMHITLWGMGRRRESIGVYLKKNKVKNIYIYIYIFVLNSMPTDRNIRRLQTF